MDAEVTSRVQILKKAERKITVFSQENLLPILHVALEGARPESLLPPHLQTPAGSVPISRENLSSLLSNSRTKALPAVLTFFRTTGFQDLTLPLVWLWLVCSWWQNQWW